VGGKPGDKFIHIDIGGPPDSKYVIAEVEKENGDRLLYSMGCNEEKVLGRYGESKHQEWKMRLVSNQIGRPKFVKYFLEDFLSFALDEHGELWVIGTQIPNPIPEIFNFQPGMEKVKVMHKTSAVSDLRKKFEAHEDDKLVIERVDFREN
jgi:hypothetical protein